MKEKKTKRYQVIHKSSDHRDNRIAVEDHLFPLGDNKQK